MKSLKDILTHKKEPVKKPKIFIGNARLSELNSTITINITELAKHEGCFTSTLINGELAYECEATLIPFKNGVNKFGNTHYLIIKNK